MFTREVLCTLRGEACAIAHLPDYAQTLTKARKGEPRKGTVDRLKLKLYPLAFAAVGVLASMGGYWKGR